jgi:hypothetical protein
MLGNGASSSAGGGVGLSEEAPHLLHRNLARVCPHSTQRSGNGICTLWTHPRFVQRSRVRFPALSDFLRSSGSRTGSAQPRETN